MMVRASGLAWRYSGNEFCHFAHRASSHRSCQPRTAISKIFRSLPGTPTGGLHHVGQSQGHGQAGASVAVNENSALLLVYGSPDKVVDHSVILHDRSEPVPTMINLHNEVSVERKGKESSLVWLLHDHLLDPGHVMGLDNLFLHDVSDADNVSDAILFQSRQLQRFWNSLFEIRICIEKSHLILLGRGVGAKEEVGQDLLLLSSLFVSPLAVQIMGLTEI